MFRKCHPSDQSASGLPTFPQGKDFLFIVKSYSLDLTIYLFLQSAGLQCKSANFYNKIFL